MCMIPVQNKNRMQKNINGLINHSIKGLVRISEIMELKVRESQKQITLSSK